MRDKEYSKYLQFYVTNAVIGNYIKRCQRVENNLHIDLDDEFNKDNGKSLLTKLTYTTAVSYTHLNGLEGTDGCSTV